LHEYVESGFAEFPAVPQRQQTAGFPRSECDRGGGVRLTGADLIGNIDLESLADPGGHFGLPSLPKVKKK
jgi:hypothetical protein